MDFECYLPIAEKLKIPVIGTVTLHSWQYADHIIGVPNNPAVIPVEGAGAKPEMNFIERVQNVWNYFVMEYYKIQMRKKHEKLYPEYFSLC